MENALQQTVLKQSRYQQSFVRFSIVIKSIKAFFAFSISTSIVKFFAIIKISNMTQVLEIFANYTSFTRCIIRNYIQSELLLSSIFSINNKSRARIFLRLFLLLVKTLLLFLFLLIFFVESLIITKYKEFYSFIVIIHVFLTKLSLESYVKEVDDLAKVEFVSLLLCKLTIYHM